MCRVSVLAAMTHCENWAHHPHDDKKHAVCKHLLVHETEKHCGVTHAQCAANRATSGITKGSHRKAPCQPCGHVLHYHLHDVKGKGVNSKFALRNDQEVGWVVTSQPLGGL